jgi:hypothetical protein
LFTSARADSHDLVSARLPALVTEQTISRPSSAPANSSLATNVEFGFQHQSGGYAGCRSRAYPGRVNRRQCLSCRLRSSARAALKCAVTSSRGCRKTSHAAQERGYVSAPHRWPPRFNKIRLPFLGRDFLRPNERGEVGPIGPQVLPSSIERKGGHGTGRKLTPRGR